MRSSILLVLLLLMIPVDLQAQSPVESCGISTNPSFIQIPDRPLAGCVDGIDDLADAASLTADVSGIPSDATILDIEVSLDIQHTWVGDLTILLEAPDGSTVTLVSGPGADTATGCGDSSDFGSESSDFNPTSFSSITFSPFGTADAEQMGSVASGSTDLCSVEDCNFQPNADGLDLSGTANFTGVQVTSLSDLFPQVDGLNGTWTIYVHDGGGGDVGTIDSFGICVTHDIIEPDPEGTFCTASNNAGPVNIPDRALAGCVDGIEDLSDSAELTAIVNTIPVGATVTDISVSMDIQHTWVGDLTILLQAPDGSTLPLVSGPGANTATGCGDSSDFGSESGDYNPTSYSTITFSPGGPTDAESMGSLSGGASEICSLESCDFFPNPDGLNLTGTANFTGIQISSFEEFYSSGDALNGIWTLFVHDGGGGDVGVVEDFEICITHEETPPPPPSGTACFDAPPGQVNIPDRDLAGCVDGIEDLADAATMSTTVSAIPSDVTITDISVSLDIQHTWVGDLTILLEAPDGSTLPLLSGPGANTATGCGDSSDLGSESGDYNPTSFSTVTFSSSAAVDAENMGAAAGGADNLCPGPDFCAFFPNADGLDLSATANFTGTQVDEFSDFYGLGTGVNGEWTIYVHDGGGGDVGVISGFSVCVTYDDTEPEPEGTFCTVSDNTGPVNIPDRPLAGCVDGIEDLSQAALLLAPVNTIPEGATVTDINVSMDIQHTWVGDLTILLQAPDGSTLPLLSGPGANTETGCGDSSDLGSESGDYNPTSYSTITFSSGGLTDAESMGSLSGGASEICSLESCDFFPNGDGLDLSTTANFSGTQISTFEQLYSLSDALNGTWKLYVHDGGGGDVGVVEDFEICITHEATEPPPPTGTACFEVPLQQVNIPDRDLAGCVDGIEDLSDAATMSVNVNGIPSDVGITDMSVSLDIQHTWVGDLTILLEAPDGSTLPLVSGPGANTATGCGDSSDFGSESGDYNPTSYSTITFSPGGLTDAELMGDGVGGADVICDVASCDFFPNPDGLDLSTTANFTGTQVNQFSDFFGLGAGVNGIWTIYVHDGGGGDVGVISGFSICFTYGDTDTTPPVPPAAPADLVLECASDVPPLIDLTAVDDVDGEITVGPSTVTVFGSCANSFVQTRTWTFTDSSGNFSSVSQTITVEDTSPPVPPAAPADLSLECADDVPPLINLTAVDNCDGAITTGPSTVTVFGSCSNSFTQTRTWTFVDSCGNFSSVSQTITVEDTSPPVPPAAPADLILQCAVEVPSLIDLTAIDNCNGPITTGPSTVTVFGDCPNDFVQTRTWTFVDDCGNFSSVSQTITVEDTTPPVLTAPPSVSVDTDPGSCMASLTYTATATDNCGVAPDVKAYIGGQLVNWPYEFPVGDTSIKWVATDNCGNEAEAYQLVTVGAINTLTTVTVTPNSQQYSDLVEFTATIDPGDCPGAGPAAVKVEFFVGTQSMGTTNLALNGAGNLEGTLVAPLLEIPSDPFDASDELGPGLKTVTAVFQGVNPSYNVVNPTTDLTITQEDALVDYTGQTLQATVNSNSGEATVALCVNIQDIDDSYRGDIRNATITFVDRDNGNAVIAGPFQVADLVIPGDTTLGTVCYDWDVDINQQSAEAFTIGFVVDNYYTRDSAEDNTVITVYKAVGDFITGGGYIIPYSSEGIYASDPGFRTNFGFNVKYNKKGTKVQGKVNIIFRRTEADGIHVYQIKSNAKPAFGVDVSDPAALFAEFTSKATLADITDPMNPIPLGGNLTLKVEMTDKGVPGTNDTIGINLTDGGGTLLYSSNWNGTSTDEMNLSGGNIVVHSGFSTDESKSVSIDKPFTFELSTDKNPFDVRANVSLTSDDKNSPVSYAVYDGNNKLIFTQVLKPGETFSFGQNVKAGMYLVIVSQADKVGQIRMIKE